MKRAVWIVLALVVISLVGLSLERSVEPGLSPSQERASPRPQPAAVNEADATSATGGIRGTLRTGNRPCSGVLTLHCILPARDDRPFVWWRDQRAHALALDLPSGPLIAEVESGPDGSFAIAGIAHGIYLLTAALPDGRTASATIRLPAPGAVVVRDLVVSDLAAGVRGRVLGPEGVPYPGYVRAIYVEDDLPADLLPAPARCDEEGRFAISGLVPGLVYLEFLEPGRHRLRRGPWSVPRDDPIAVRLSDGTRTLTGRVLRGSDLAAVAGAEVTSVGTWGAARAVADEEGGFTLTLSTEATTVAATARGHSPQSVDVEPNAERVEIHLSGTASLRGRVNRATDGSPIAGQRVHVVPSDPGSLWNWEGHVAVTDSVGGFRIEGLPATRVCVFATGSGLVAEGVADAARGLLARLEVDLEPGGTTDVKLSLVPAAGIEGTVVDERGQPLSGITVRARPEFEWSRGIRMSATRASPWVPHVHRPAVTDANGSFALSTLIPGLLYEFVAEGQGRPRVVTEQVWTRPGVIGNLRIRLPAPAWLEVTVVDADGDAPIEGTTIEASRRDAEGDFDRLPGLWVTDRKGCARVGPLPPGAIGLSARHPHYALQAEPTQVGEEPVLLRLARGRTISGHVRRPDGSPPSNCRVWVQSEESWRLDVWTRTEVDGSFEVASLPEDTYEVTAFENIGHSKFEASRLVKAGTRDLTLELGLTESRSPAGTLTIRVTDSDGQPVASALVSAGGRRRAHTTNGRVSFPVFEKEGPLTIVVSWARSVSGEVLGATAEGGVPAEAGEFGIRLPASRSIAGIVVDTDGRPVEGVWISAGLRVDPRDGMRDIDATAWSDPEGRFRLVGLGSWKYSLRFRVPPGYVKPVVGGAEAGASGVRIELRPTGAARLKIVDWAGRAVPGAVVNVYGPGERLHVFSLIEQFVAGATGEARLEGLALDAKYDLEVKGPPDRTDLLTFALDEWRPVDGTHAFARAHTIEGIVRSVDGHPVPDAYVHWQVPGGSWEDRGMETTGKDGRFHLKQVPEGEIEVSALGEGPALNGGSTQRVKAGATGVALTIDPGLEIRVRIEGWPHEISTARGRLFDEKTQEGFLSVRRVWVRSGVVRFSGLPDDRTYTLWVGPVGDDCLFLTGLRPGAPEFTARLTPGQSIRGRLVCPPGARDLKVDAAWRGEEVDGEVAADGSYVIRGLPDLLYRLWGSAWRGSGWFRGSASDVPAGSVRDIQLEDR